MAWIELHDTLPDHDKVMSVSEALNMDKDMVVGKLVRLWVWALNNREDGFFKLRDMGTIAEVMRYKGKPQRLVDALVSSHLLDKTDDGYTIHDWEERVGMLLERREKKRSQNRENVRKHREKKATCNALQEHYTEPNVSQCNAATVPKPYQNHTVPVLESAPLPPTQNEFISPTLEEVAAFVRENSYCMKPEAFVDYYGSNGWMVGKTKMTDWKAAVRVWERREREYRKEKNPALDYSQRQYTEADVAKMGILSFDEEDA